MTCTLPRLAVVSDVTVKDGDGCAQALFRLLATYPRDKLTILQLKDRGLNERCALEGATYFNMPTPWNRLLFTRFHGLVAIFEYFYRSLVFYPVTLRLKEEKAEAVLTVIEKMGWITAFKVARRLRLPLHVIVYDGPQHWYADHPVLGPAITRMVRRALQYAETRNSVSAPLEDKMAQLSGVSGSVLWPSRSPLDEQLGKELAAIPRARASLSAVYFGSIASNEILAMLDRFARVISRFGFILDVWGGVSPNIMKSPGWHSRVFRHNGFFRERREFIRNVRASATLLYLPFPFDDEVTRYSFPSKLVDYTLIGIPIVIHAPADSAVAAWCALNNCSAKLFTHLDWERISNDLGALLEDEEGLEDLAKGAFVAGEASFSQARLFAQFQAALTRT